MSTPPYVPPFVGAAGLVVNGYPSIQADNIQKFLNIYGQNQFVGPSSAIYQLLSILSLKQADQNAALQLDYNQSSPQTAVGAGLDRVVKMNGVAREPFTYSTALLSLTGTPNAVVTGAAAQDQNGNLWTLPSPFTFSPGGSFAATATCTTPGNVAAEPGTISIVATPQIGWAPPTGTVTNNAAASPGLPVETDSQLRARQAISVALPSTTPISATIAAVRAVPGVTRIAPGYPTPGGPGTSIENPTGSVDSPWGNPAHSISMVVEGGADSDVALAIYDKRTLGCFTNGTTSVAVADPVTGFLNTMRFYRPTYVAVYLLVQLTGYGSTPTTATVAAVRAALVAYLNSLSIGETVSLSALIYEAMNVNASLLSPAFGVSITMGVATATTPGATINGSNAMTVSSGTGIVIGQLITSTSVPIGTTVTNVVGTSVTMSANATFTGAAPTVFSTLTATDLVMPNFFYVAQGLVAGVAVLP